MSESNRYTDYIERALDLIEPGELEEEASYKLHIVERLHLARDAVLVGNAEWEGKLYRWLRQRAA